MNGLPGKGVSRRFKEIFYLPSSPEKALCLTESINALCICDAFVMLLMVSTSQPGKWGGFIPFLSVLMSSASYSSYFLLLAEHQAYGEINISSNCTWQGLSYLAKAQSDQKNQHSSFLCSPLLLSTLHS